MHDVARPGVRGIHHARSSKHGGHGTHHTAVEHTSWSWNTLVAPRDSVVSISHGEQVQRYNRSRVSTSLLEQVGLSDTSLG